MNTPETDTQQKLTRHQLAAMLGEAYTAGSSVRDLCQQFELPYSRTYRLLQLVGTPMRPRGGHHDMIDADTAEQDTP